MTAVSDFALEGSVQMNISATKAQDAVGYPR